jgi:mRNA-degrading endonuclease YafQ of YafQ-DinJ toxin-antitoxin module
MTIYTFSRYQRSMRRLDPQIRKTAVTQIALFKRDPFDPRLGTHRLHGKLKAQWSFSVDSRHRVLFEFLDDANEEVVFLDIGTHALYS